MELDEIKTLDMLYRMANGEPDPAAVVILPLVDVDYLTPGILNARSGTHDNYPGRYLVQALVVADDADAHSGDRLRPMREHPQFQWKEQVEDGPMMFSYAFTFLVPDEYTADIDRMKNGKWSEVSEAYWAKLDENETDPETRERFMEFKQKAQSGELDHDPEEATEQADDED